MTKIISTILFTFILIICGCGVDTTKSSQSADTNKGDIAFTLKWDTSSISSKSEIQNPQSEIHFYAPIDCSAIGVLTVTANVYDSSNTYLINGGPWDCTAHTGTITNVPAGDSRKITVYGKDSSDRIIYRGNVTGVTITANQTTDAGSVTMSSVAFDTTAPTDGSLSASAGSSQVSLSWSNFSDSGGIDYYKLVYSTSTTPSSCSSGTQIYLGSGTSYTHTGLTNGSTYYYRICATDNAGNTSNGATANAAPVSGGTTGSAPSAPTGVLATAGSSQVSISWSSVSGATSYNIYWSTTSGVTKTTGTKITGATSPYTHTGRTNGTTYYYVVTAVNSYGESGESSQVSGTPTGIMAKHFQVDTNGTLMTSLVSYWKLEDATDFYGANNGTNIGVTYGSGKINNGAIQDAVSDRIQLPNFDINTAGNPFSVNLWCKTSSTANLPNGEYIVNRRKGTMTFAIGSKRGDSSNAEVTDFGGQYITGNTGNLNNGNWHMLTLVCSSNTSGTLYIDGGNAVTNNSINFTTQNLTDADLFGGLDSGNNLRSWIGTYDEIGMWSKALSAQEIADLYNSGNGQTMVDTM